MTSSEDPLRKVSAMVKILEGMGIETRLSLSFVINTHDDEDLPLPPEELDILDDAANDIVSDPSNGLFLRKFAETWLYADSFHKRALAPLWRTLISEDESMSKSLDEDRRAFRDFDRRALS